MKSNEVCKRIVLAGAEGCRVLYCESCHVAELEVGAMSLRLELTAFNSLSELLKEASARLAVFNAAQAAHQFEANAKNVH